MKRWFPVISEVIACNRIDRIENRTLLNAQIHLHNFRNYDGRQLTKIGRVCYIITVSCLFPPNGLFDKFRANARISSNLSIHSYIDQIAQNMNEHAFWRLWLSQFSPYLIITSTGMQVDRWKIFIIYHAYLNRTLLEICRGVERNQFSSKKTKGIGCSLQFIKDVFTKI